MQLIVLSAICTNYSILDDSWRDITYNVTPGTPIHCDDVLVAGWYKLKLNGIPANMPVKPPEIGHCGTTAPIWYSGKSYELIV